MTPFDKITPKETQDIYDYIAEYQGSCKVSLDQLLAPWDNAKREIFKMFGENLILSQEIEYDEDAQKVNEDIKKLIYRHCLIRDMVALQATLGRYISSEWIESVSEVFNQYCFFLLDYSDVIDLFSNFSVEQLNKFVHALSVVLNVDNLRTNRIDTDIELPMLNKTFKYNKGTKVFKVLKKITQFLGIDNNELERFRNDHSMVLNDIHQKGTLCLSIHPLDYMTMSDNTYGWFSCMSWEDQGEYRMGTVEMMNSPYVVVGYLAGSDLMRWYDGFEWNSKKWRSLFILTPDFISGVKGYPYHSNTLEGKCLDWLRDLTSNNAEYYGEFEDKKYLVGSGKTEHPRIERFNPYTDLMYNDFCGLNFSNTHAYFTNNPEVTTISLNYSGVAECMTCGATDAHFAACRLGCENCEDLCYCECCGEYYYENQLTYIEDHCLCEYCTESYTSYCECTGDAGLNRSMIYVDIINPQENFNRYIIDLILTPTAYRHSPFYKIQPVDITQPISSRISAKFYANVTIPVNELSMEDLKELNYLSPYVYDLIKEAIAACQNAN